jgi:hypothetical protein
MADEQLTALDAGNWDTFCALAHRYLRAAAGDETVSLSPSDFILCAPLIAGELEALAALLRSAVRLLGQTTTAQ